MTTVHFVYPHGSRISTPDAIGRNVGKYLEQEYAVMYYDFAHSWVIKPAPGDVFLP